MFKINYIIYKLDTYNLQTKIVLYRDHEKVVKQIDDSQTSVFYNFNSKIPQIGDLAFV